MLIVYYNEELMKLQLTNTITKRFLEPYKKRGKIGHVNVYTVNNELESFWSSILKNIICKTAMAANRMAEKMASLWSGYLRVRGKNDPIFYSSLGGVRFLNDL